MKSATLLSTVLLAGCLQGSVELDTTSEEQLFMAVPIQGGDVIPEACSDGHCGGQVGRSDCDDDSCVGDCGGRDGDGDCDDNGGGGGGF